MNNKEIKQQKDSAQCAIQNVVGSTWCATMQLRWKLIEVNMSDGTAQNVSELQQMWQNDTGEQKWERVPFVEQYYLQR